MFHLNRIVFGILVPSAAATSERPVCVTPESGHGLLWLSQRLLIYAPAGIQQSWPHLRCCSQQLVKPQKRSRDGSVCVWLTSDSCVRYCEMSMFMSVKRCFFFLYCGLGLCVCLFALWLVFAGICFLMPALFADSVNSAEEIINFSLCWNSCLFALPPTHQLLFPVCLR